MTVSLRDSEARAILDLLALPGDDWQPQDWAVFDVARQHLADLPRRIARSEEKSERRRERSQGQVRAPKVRGKSATWNRSRRWIEGRSGGACEAKTPACTGRGAHAHHIVMRSQGGDDGTGNLLWVCPPCHSYIHEHPAESYDAGWLRHTPAGEVDHRPTAETR